MDPNRDGDLFPFLYTLITIYALPHRHTTRRDPILPAAAAQASNERTEMFKHRLGCRALSAVNYSL